MTTALITGATRGIGRQVALDLTTRGRTVWVAARDLARGRAVAEELPGDARPVQLDVTDDASVQSAAEVVGADGGALDVLVNNAGIAANISKPPADTTATHFLATFGVNLLGPVRVTQAFLPLLRRSTEPRVVMVSSGMGSITITSDPDRLEASITSLVYPSSKAALNMVASQYARALPDVTFTAADPGYTATDMNGHSGHQSVAEGAEAIVRVATDPRSAPSGGFVDRHGPVPW